MLTLIVTVALLILCAYFSIITIVLLISCAYFSTQLQGIRYYTPTITTSNKVYGASTPKLLKILTLNLQGLPWPLIPAPDKRIEKIRALLLSKKKDVSVFLFQEVFTSRFMRVIQDCFSDWNLVRGNFRRFPRVFGSGLVTVSKYPIARSYCMAFGKGKGADVFAEKGVLVSTILVGDQEIVIANTHLQNTVFSNRENQRQFNIVNSMTGIDFFGGDLNSDATDNQDEIGERVRISPNKGTWKNQILDYGYSKFDGTAKTLPDKVSDHYPVEFSLVIVPR